MMMMTKKERPPPSQSYQYDTDHGVDANNSNDNDATDDDDREEGTIPYIPELPVSTESFINYNRSIFNVRGIHTAPAGLESTSLVLVYGIGEWSSVSLLSW